MSLRRRITIRDPRRESKIFNHRAIIALLGMFALVAVLLSNLYHLQVVQHVEYSTRSNDNRIRILPIPPNRGLIYDRNGVLLADNRPVFSLEVVPEDVDDLKGTLQQLSTLLNIPQDDIDDFLEQTKVQRRFKQIPLKSELTQEEVARFAVNQYRFPGVSVQARLKRYYPFGDALTHVIGYVAKINQRDLKKLDQRGELNNYRATRNIGKLGIEKFYEDILHGQAGFQEVEVNNRGRILRQLDVHPPQPGRDIYLNIDINLQLTAQKALQDHRGAAVVLDPRNGSVLAMYSNPSYDPNPFVQGISSKAYRRLLSSKNHPLINRATQGQYPPASTIKPILGLLALDEGVVNPKTRIWDPGYYQPPNVDHRYRDWKKWGHGWVNITTAIEQSCDTFFYEMAVKLGIDKISTFMKQFGFGRRTGIDISEESTGVMPSRQWKRARHHQRWWLGDTITVGIGQGYWTATPLQLADAISRLAMKGKGFTPRLVQALGSDAGTQQIPPDSIPSIEVKDPDDWDVVTQGMHLVNTGIHGTARRAWHGAEYQSAGKSGTAQVIGLAQDEEYDAEDVAERHRDNAMFVAFAPFKKPQAVIAIALENAGGGSSQAAPVARIIMDKVMELNKKTAAEEHQLADQDHQQHKEKDDAR